MTNNGSEENRIQEKVNISKLPLNTPQFYKLDKSQDWVEKLLKELNEKADTHSPEENLAKTHFNLDMELTKCFKPEYGEYLLIKGKIQTLYLTQCVRTLDEMEEALEVEFNVCFLHQRFEDDEAFSEQLEIFEKDQVYELYFYNKGHVDLFESIHEVVYLNLNQYPVKDEDAPLVWAGTDNDTKH